MHVVTRVRLLSKFIFASEKLHLAHCRHGVLKPVSSAEYRINLLVAFAVFSTKQDMMTMKFSPSGAEHDYKKLHCQR